MIIHSDTREIKRLRSEIEGMKGNMDMMTSQLREAEIRNNAFEAERMEYQEKERRMQEKIKELEVIRFL